jgi:hypothetical protein
MKDELSPFPTRRIARAGGDAGQARAVAAQTGDRADQEEFARLAAALAV